MKVGKATIALSWAHGVAMHQMNPNEFARILGDRAGHGWMNIMFVTAAVGVIVFAGGQPLISHVTENLRIVSDLSIGWLSR
jgi:hypothetical protein